MASGSTAAQRLQHYDQELQTAPYKAEFHGDESLAEKQRVPTTLWQDLASVLTWKNLPSLATVVEDKVTGQRLDCELIDESGSTLVGSLPEDGPARHALLKDQVMKKYEAMLHPPLTYLGDAFQYRTPDGKFNVADRDDYLKSVLHPHLGQAGAPYAKTVPAKAHLLGAQPDPGDIFDRLMARDNNVRQSSSGLSSMLIYHATIIIHDIFRTNDKDRNISDTSSYLDLSPLYGYTAAMQEKVRDRENKLGLLKPDTFAEDRLLRQPPGVCIMLVMYNRYHNYVATQLRRINENGRFTIPPKYGKEKLIAVVDAFFPAKDYPDLTKYLRHYEAFWKKFRKNGTNVPSEHTETELQKKIDVVLGKLKADDRSSLEKDIAKFKQDYDAAWDKYDNDLFNTARLITCGMYVNISIHDYLRALMGFHQYNTTFTLDPRIEINEPVKKDAVSRGIGNQVTVEFNLLYRFHCAISKRDEAYTEGFIKDEYGKYIVDENGKKVDVDNWDPKTITLPQFLGAALALKQHEVKQEPWDIEFGFGMKKFKRDDETRLFNDKNMVKELLAAMEEPISEFGARNTPTSLKAIEIMAILQARKWEVGTLNDFREFFGMTRHKTFQDITKNVGVQDALRDLYDHPDKVELYPGIFCEGNQGPMGIGLDPGPASDNCALWTAIFSDAITLVRSDRFYTVDWNTNSLTSWGMKEVTPDSDVLKGSVFHRLLQRAFPEWFPYNSIRFFHPFYTTQKNSELAVAQGFKDLSFEKVPNPKGSVIPRYIDKSPAKQPEKPVYIDNYHDVQTILSENSDVFVNPACLDLKALPESVKQILTQPRPHKINSESTAISPAQKRMFLEYFAAMARIIVKREVINIPNPYSPDQNTKPARKIYQIDVIRDLAIPVVTRFVADVLGFSHRVRNETNPRGEFSENVIYEHITNCQVFLAYNVDETKMLKRRNFFKSSMNFLFNLAKDGSIKEANRWPIFRAASKFFTSEKGVAEEKKIKEWGAIMAERILKKVKDPGKAAAVLLLVALDGAYHFVLAFASVLDYFFDDMAKAKENCEWAKIQEYARTDDAASDEAILQCVMEAQRLSVKLPVVRKVAEPISLTIGGKTCKFEKGQNIILDLHVASREPSIFQDPEVFRIRNPSSYLAYGSSLSHGLIDFNARDIAVSGLTAMTKVLAQMKNLRRGHHTQGRLKRVRIDQTSEGYSNFMAPKRVEAIMRTKKLKDPAGSSTEYSKILKPASETYLTPGWDEMIPFPQTWKVRFDGYGVSNYNFDHMNQTPPFALPEQPQGPSHFGGSFAQQMCICRTAGHQCKCNESAALQQPQLQNGIIKEHKKPATVDTGSQHSGCGF